MNRKRQQTGLIVALVVGSSTLALAANKVVVVPLSNSDKVEALEARVAKLENLLAGASRNGHKLVFSGINIHLIDGSGDTGGPVNGLGNLIVGYNEERSSGNDRSGSHNLVVGAKHNYSSYGGFVAGFNNSVSGPNSSISGGSNNIAEGDSSSVSAGGSNRAIGNFSSVSGGYDNEAGGLYSTVSGGSSGSVAGGDDWLAGTIFEDH